MTLKKTNLKKDCGVSTKAVHGGSYPDKETGSVIPPIFQTSTYAQTSPGVHKGFEYTRSHNPTRVRLEENLAALEGGKYCVATASGMSSATLLLETLPRDSRVLCGNDVYGGTYRLMNTVYAHDLEIDFVDTTNAKTFRERILEYHPAMVWIETPSNPLMKLTDIAKTAEAAHKVGAVLVVDNTFMSPCFQSPLELGADVVLHSLTKYINGHSDVVAGCLVTNHKGLYDKLWTLQNSIGPSLSPFDSWLVLRGVKTLKVRMDRHNENAKKVADFLHAHPQVEKVLYPGHKTHPQRALARRQMSAGGGMMSFYVKGGLKKAKSVMQKTKLFTLAESLGGVESLIEHPGIMTHASIPKKIRERNGISDALIRISVGIEDVEDLIADLKQALA